MWRSLSRVSLAIFLGLVIWAGIVYKDNSIASVTWEDLDQNTNIPNNYQVRMPVGTALHPLALISETSGSKLEIYQYIYLPQDQVDVWKTALEAYDAGDQQPIVDAGKKLTQVVIVDTTRYNGKTTAETPQGFELESGVVGYVNRGFDHLKDNQAEFKSLCGHLPTDKVIVVSENPAQRPSEALPVAQVVGAALALLAAIAFAVRYRQSIA